MKLLFTLGILICIWCPTNATEPATNEKDLIQGNDDDSPSVRISTENPTNLDLMLLMLLSSDAIDPKLMYVLNLLENPPDEVSFAALSLLADNPLVLLMTQSLALQGGHFDLDPEIVYTGSVLEGILESQPNFIQYRLLENLSKAGRLGSIMTMSMALKDTDVDIAPVILVTLLSGENEGIDYMVLKYFLSDPGLINVDWCRLWRTISVALASTDGKDDLTRMLLILQDKTKLFNPLILLPMAEDINQSKKAIEMYLLTSGRNAPGANLFLLMHLTGAFDTCTDDCRSNPCQNGGTCTDDIFSYTCACAEDFEGSDCSTPVTNS